MGTYADRLLVLRAGDLGVYVAHDAVLHDGERGASVGDGGVVALAGGAGVADGVGGRGELLEASGVVDGGVVDVLAGGFDRVLQEEVVSKDAPEERMQD